MIKVRYIVTMKIFELEVIEDFELYIAPFIYLFVEIKESNILYFVVDTIIIHGKYMHSFVSKSLETIFKVPVPCLFVTTEKLI